jgi:hypothetical protein
MSNDYPQGPAGDSQYPYQNVPQPQNRTNNSRLFLIIGVIVLAVLAAATWMVVGPKLADKIDSGVQACKFISEGKDAEGQPTTDPSSSATEAPEGDADLLTVDEYKKLRDVFDNSRHDDLKQAGTRFVDDVYGMNIFGAIGSYSALNSACANHGYPLPPLDMGF